MQQAHVGRPAAVALFEFRLLEQDRAWIITDSDESIR